MCTVLSAPGVSRNSSRDFRSDFHQHSHCEPRQDSHLMPGKAPAATAAAISDLPGGDPPMIVRAGVRARPLTDGDGLFNLHIVHSACASLWVMPFMR